MKSVYTICMSLVFVLLSFGFGHSQEFHICKNRWLNRWEIQGETGQTLYLRKDFWRSGRYFLKDAVTHQSVGQVKWNWWLKRWEYRKGE